MWLLHWTLIWYWSILSAEHCSDCCFDLHSWCALVLTNYPRRQLGYNDDQLPHRMNFAVYTITREIPERSVPNFLRTVSGLLATMSLQLLVSVALPEVLWRGSVLSSSTLVTLFIYLLLYLFVGCSVVERRSLTGEHSLVYTGPAADG